MTITTTASTAGIEKVPAAATITKLNMFAMRVMTVLVTTIYIDLQIITITLKKMATIMCVRERESWVEHSSITGIWA
jgi:hypothetical protein